MGAGVNGQSKELDEKSAVLHASIPRNGFLMQRCRNVNKEITTKIAKIEQRAQEIQEGMRPGISTNSCTASVLDSEMCKKNTLSGNLVVALD